MRTITTVCCFLLLALDITTLSADEPKQPMPSALKGMKKWEKMGQAAIKRGEEWSIRIDKSGAARLEYYGGVAGYKYFHLTIPKDVALAAVSFKGAIVFGWEHGKKIDDDIFQADMTYIGFIP